MATYLSICQDVRRECQVSGVGPSTVLAQTGQLANLVAWVSKAYVDIQNARKEWAWLRSTFSINTVVGTDTYAGAAGTDTRLGASITRFSRWWEFGADGEENVTAYLQSSGVAAEYRLTFLPWSDFRALYRFGAQSNQRPAHFTIDPQRNLVIGPKPDAVYVLLGEYQRSPQILAADADIPEMPSEYHDLITYWAMQKYGATSVAQETYARSLSEGGRLMRALEDSQLPKIDLAGFE